MHRKILITLSLFELAACQEIDLLSKKIGLYHKPINHQKIKTESAEATQMENAQAKMAILLEDETQRTTNLHTKELLTAEKPVDKNISSAENPDEAIDLDPKVDQKNSPNLAAEISEFSQSEQENQMLVSDEATEEIPSIKLHERRWQIRQASGKENFNFNPDHWIFKFEENGNYKAFGNCNHVYGKFAADAAQTFRLRKLATTNNNCPQGRDEEVMIFNDLILANQYLIQDGQLLLKQDEKTLIVFEATNADVSFSLKPNKPKSPAQKYKAKPRKRLIKNKAALGLAV
jgi:heat shock protein HslJ